MDNQKIKHLYFDWMCSLVMPNFRDRGRYEELLTSLNNTVFQFSIPLDENRYIDGMALRYRFGYEKDIPREDIYYTLDNKECSMLEMMVALSLKCEEEILYDPDLNSKVTIFYEMIRSLKLDHMVDSDFDLAWVNYRINCLLNHEYESNGSGGLFTIKSPKHDLRTVDIWYQMCWYIDALLKER